MEKKNDIFRQEMLSSIKKMHVEPHHCISRQFIDNKLNNV